VHETFNLHMIFFVLFSIKLCIGLTLKSMHKRAVFIRIEYWKILQIDYIWISWSSCSSRNISNPGSHNLTHPFFLILIQAKHT